MRADPADQRVRIVRDGRGGVAEDDAVDPLHGRLIGGGAPCRHRRVQLPGGKQREMRRSGEVVVGHSLGCREIVLVALEIPHKGGAGGRQGG